jgi:hypothetical protein
MSIEEAIGRLKVVDGDEPQPLSGPITIGRKLHLTQEQVTRRIWDRHQRLLAKETRGTNRLYVLNVQVAQPLCLAARQDDEAW